MIGGAPVGVVLSSVTMIEPLIALYLVFLGVAFGAAGLLVALYFLHDLACKFCAVLCRLLSTPPVRSNVEDKPDHDTNKS